MIKDEFSKSLIKALETPEIDEKARILQLVPVAIASAKLVWHDGLFWAIYGKELRN